MHLGGQNRYFGGMGKESNWRGQESFWGIVNILLLNIGGGYQVCSFDSFAFFCMHIRLQNTGCF